jgi:lipocalin
MVLKNKSRERELHERTPDEQVAYLYEFSKSELASDKASEVVAEMQKIHEEAGPEGEESLEAIRELENENGFKHLISLILLDVQKGGLDGVRKWLSTVGGLREAVSANSVAILAGESRAVSTWHYSMSDSVLNTLMYLCFLNENGSIRVDNTCYSQDGKLQQSIGVANVQNAPVNSKLKVTFLPKALRWLPVGRGDYWILKIDEDYQVALVGTPNKKYLWLLSRSQTLDPVVVEEYLNYAQHLGYDLKDLIYTKQK